MRRPSAGLALGSVLCLALFAASIGASTGCDDGDGSGGTGGSGGSDPCAVEVDADGCFNYECFTETKENVSFQADVLPIFELSCSLSSSCHGNRASPDTPAGYQPYLGEVDQEETPSDIQLIRDIIISQDSHVNPSMKIIDPGKPESSFLMHKMDGDLDCTALTCNDGDCGDGMPQGTMPLKRETRDIVRTWIAQGAQDN